MNKKLPLYKTVRVGPEETLCNTCHHARKYHDGDFLCTCCPLGNLCKMFTAKTLPVVGMLRIKNEAAWIAEVIQSIEPLCDEIFVLDDHSTDDTVKICQQSAKVRLLHSPFEGLDESRDKNWLLEAMIPHGPEWVLCIDGDEVLEKNGPDIIRQTIQDHGENTHAFSLRIAYMWNDKNTQRVDGVYERFARPSLFRMINPDFRFQTTPWNGNLHCSSIPQELIAGFGACPARLKHYGYMDRARRIEKYAWYNHVDPNNPAEDCYRHMVQGDVPEIPSWQRLLHAGPLVLANFEE